MLVAICLRGLNWVSKLGEFPANRIGAFAESAVVGTIKQ
jgi:hypothetical protein